MCENVILSVAVLTYGHHLELHVLEHNALVPVPAEYHLLSPLEEKKSVSLVLPVGELGVGAVVEDYAVDEEFHHRCA